MLHNCPYFMWKMSRNTALVKEGCLVKLAQVFVLVFPTALASFLKTITQADITIVWPVRPFKGWISKMTWASKKNCCMTFPLTWSIMTRKGPPHLQINFHLFERQTHTCMHTHTNTHTQQDKPTDKYLPSTGSLSKMPTIARAGPWCHNKLHLGLPRGWRKLK